MELVIARLWRREATRFGGGFTTPVWVWPPTPPHCLSPQPHPPWVRKELRWSDCAAGDLRSGHDGAAHAGRDRAEDLTTVADFEVGEGQTWHFVTYALASAVPAPIDPGHARRTRGFLWTHGAAAARMRFCRDL